MTSLLSRRKLLILFAAMAAIVALAGCPQKRGIKCSQCGEVAVYTPGGPNMIGALLYVCPNGHENGSSRLIR